MKLENIGSYPKDDVTFLLKDIGNLVKEVDTEEREKLNQSGVHYSEMLPLEYEPTEEYLKLFKESLKTSAKRMAELTATVAEKIYSEYGQNGILISLARAGTPIGVLIKRYIRNKYNIELNHYSISIIRGKGFDKNALNYIIDKHGKESLVFVDGWTGKGAITKELEEALSVYDIKPILAVLSDPAYSANIIGTFDDFLIPSACLNSTVSGLISRTFHREDIIGKDDFHGVKYYQEKLKSDYSNYFVDTVEKEFSTVDINTLDLKNSIEKEREWRGFKSVESIQKKFKIDNIHFVKPGVGETTRVLLRRVPWKILIHPTAGNDVKHILQLAEERNIPIEEFDDMSYSCCGIIKSKTKSLE